ncbi:MAG: glycosyltransferase, partial [Bacteroidales bacterium]
MQQAKAISLVISVFNEDKNLPELYKVLIESVSDLPYSFEFLFVNDGSTDNSFTILSELLQKDQ